MCDVELNQVLIVTSLLSFSFIDECIPIVANIIDPPIIVSRLGCSLITSHTQIGPSIVSSKKNKFTSAP